MPRRGANSGCSIRSAASSGGLHYNYSIHTEQANVDWIRRFILFHGKRHAADMGAPEGTVSPCSRIGSAGPPRLPEVFTSP